MPKFPAVRSWATPLTISSFLLMSATGVLMFFELDRGLVVVVHQWFSWFFLAGAAGHITANFRPFKNHFKSAGTKAIAIIFAGVVAASLFSWGRMTGPQMKRPIELALVDAPLSSLAGVTHMEPDVLIGRFKAHGIVATGQQSIREISLQSGVGENRLLGIVFLPE
ncbi:DUF4405 domain-containing protein [Rhodopseudomonas sp. AAP120]|uniref:DUF4405 domain-containing protein n=1 Tax=Rhodopseudomonas sp. AAP120 TaxID=1523430 RepID=UPI0012E2D19A|nr:DUF4405 domain-containing protein [Rhodopseudomonas sp. AAP120]